MSQSPPSTEIDTRLLKRVKINVYKLIRGSASGEYRSLFMSHGIEYSESRKYCFGDDSRYIDWKLSGRMNSLYTKYYDEERNRIIWVLFDCSASMNIGAESSAFDVGAEIALTLISLAISQKDKVGGAFFDSSILYSVSPTRVRNIYSRIYSILAQCRFLQEKADIELAVNFTRKVLLQRSLIIVISDFLYSSCVEQLSRLSNDHDLLIIRIYYNVRDTMPGSPLFSFIAHDRRLGAKRLLSAHSIKSQLIEDQKKSARIWNAFSFKKNVSYLELSTLDNVYQKLVAFFRKKGKT